MEHITQYQKAQNSDTALLIDVLREAPKIRASGDFRGHLISNALTRRSALPGKFFGATIQGSNTLLRIFAPVNIH
jgi:hypothetical protein